MGTRRPLSVPPGPHLQQPPLLFLEIGHPDPGAVKKKMDGYANDQKRSSNRMNHCEYAFYLIRNQTGYRLKQNEHEENGIYSLEP